MKKIPIIVDCDPGVDDAIALALLSLKKHKYNIKLLSSCSGNLDINITTNNLQYFAKNFFNNTALSQGLGKPLVRNFEPDAEFVHGKSGLGEIELEKQDFPISDNPSHEKMFEILNNSSEQITFLCLGPLTNIALLIKTYPQIINKINKIYCMIGSINGIGNITEYAEFNAYYDPEAFKIVAESNIPLVFNTIEVGLKCRFNKNRVEKELANSNTQLTLKTMINGMTEPDDENTICLFDPCSFLSLDKPEFFNFINTDIEVFADNTTPGKSILTPNLAAKNVYIVPKDTKAIENYILSELKKL